MTDQDNLRDRMVRVLNRVDDEAAARDDGTDVASTRELAQAIIDEFGLTVESAVDRSIRTTDKRTGNVRYGEKARVVGKWEAEE